MKDMQSQAFTLALHPDRLLPADPAVRGIAPRLYAAVRDLPIISPHGHADPRMLLDDVPFRDPAQLFVTPDHYVTRLLRASGVPLEALGVGQGPLTETAAREAWRLLCSHWYVFRATPVRYWLESELAEIFGVVVRPSAATADSIYDHLADRLTQDAYKPRALFTRFKISVLATTDDPCDDLTAHAALVADPTWSGRVIPTFRPDRYLEASEAGWSEAVAHLGEVSGVDTGTYAGWVTAMEGRRLYFIEHGARSADHAHTDAGTEPLETSEADRIYQAAQGGTALPSEAVALRRHMLLEMARMSTEDGLTMTLHVGVRRGHHGPSNARFGPDTGHRTRHPAARRLHRPAAAPARAVRHAPQPEPGALHARRDRVLTRAGAAGRLLPVGLHRGALVVPRRTRRGPALALGDHRHRGFLPDVGLHR